MNSLASSRSRASAVDADPTFCRPMQRRCLLRSNPPGRAMKLHRGFRHTSPRAHMPSPAEPVLSGSASGSDAVRATEFGTASIVLSSRLGHIPGAYHHP